MDFVIFFQLAPYGFLTILSALQYIFSSICSLHLKKNDEVGRRVQLIKSLH